MLLFAAFVAGIAEAPPPMPVRPVVPASGIPILRPARPILPQRPGRAQVLAAVQAEWRTYDRRGQGRLGPLEFGTWVMRANGAEVQAPGAGRDAAGIKPVTAMNVTAAAFAKADANHDGGVTPEELTSFLMAQQAGTQ